MEFPKFDLKNMSILKTAGIGLGVVLALTFVLSLFRSPILPSLRKGEFSVSSMGAPSYGGGVMQGSAGLAYDAAMPEFSARNAIGIMPSPMPPMGDDSEAFEVTDYSASVETRDLDKTCGAVAGLKAKDYVIFEMANRYEHGCNYSFKVAKGHVEEALAAIKALDPKDLSENTRTIKRQVDDYTSEVDILQKKKAVMEVTLAEAVAAYDEIAKLAAQGRDTESLAKVIDSKLQLIERITQTKIEINAQLDRLARAKAEQLDRLDYTYFNVNVYEAKFVDGRQIKDSWKAAVREFVQDVNRIAQDMTVNLVVLLFLAAQYALYILILVLIAKYGWKAVKRIWLG